MSEHPGGVGSDRPLKTADLAAKLVEAVADAFVVVDEQGRIVLVNAQGEGMLGARPDDMVGRPVDVSLSPVRLDGGVPVVAVIRDATERIRTESALRGAVAYTRAAIEQAPDAIFTADLSGRYTEVNEAACALLGYSRTELLGMTINDLIPPDEVRRLAAERQRMLNPGNIEITEWRLRRKDGTSVPVEVSANILDDGRWQAIVRDISERKRVESVLSLHSIIVAKMAEGVVLVRTADGRIVYTNPRFDQMLGYAAGELAGKTFADITEGCGCKGATGFAGETVEQLDHQDEVHSELRNLRKDGTVICCRARIVNFEHPELGPVWVSVQEDITEERQAQEAAEKLRRQLEIADRMSSLGTLAAGVGHEINNPLTYVISNLHMARKDLRELASALPADRAATLVEMIDEACMGAERVRKIVRGLRAFSRVEEGSPVAVDVVEVLESSISMTLHELRQKARVVRSYDSVDPVRADEARLAQVFINLLVNAAQAIGEGKAQRNEIRVAVRARPPGMVVVEVADTGHGIAVEHLGRVFDPFFTTKPVGQGTGLGLSISHNIVTALGGTIEVESVAGSGSTFRVALPAAPIPVETKT